MLQIPFKKSTASDLVSPLLRHLGTEYSANVADESLADLQKLQLMRNGAAAVATASDEGLQVLLAFQAHLKQLAPRLVLPPEGALLSFAWHDAFLKGKTAEQSTFAFERCAILFNCGALESAVGAAADRSAEEGLKKACKAFQHAAGYFGACKALLPELAGKGAVTPDTTSQGLGMAAALMLAQAQACYYEMAVSAREKLATFHCLVWHQL
jgi:programmed cell death 6-interacting protein